MRNILLVAIGQSNWQGAGRAEQGGLAVRRRSIYTGETDPFDGCNNKNQGCSCFPWLIDLAYQRGVKLDVLNYAIGGASIYDYCGRTGATVSGGSAATPAAQGYMSPISLSGGTSAAVEGGAQFDPFSLLSRTRVAIAARVALGQYSAVVSYWANGESDAGLSAATYASGLQSIANYMIASGVHRHFIGLASKPPSKTTGQYDDLNDGIDLAVAALASTGKVSKGHSMYAHYGSSPPLYPESDGTSYVHMTARGQEVQAKLVDAVLASAGY